MNQEELKKLRLANNLTQDAFAVAVGCLQHQVSEWELGKVQLPDRRLKYFMERMHQLKILGK